MNRDQGLHATNDGFRLLIGSDPATGQPRYYDGEGGLCTIGRPGVGKSQCHMIPNLLTWRGPAIVLDVTGNLWRETSKQRSTYGPVYKIDPDDPDSSDHYNPFDFIRVSHNKLWGDAQAFAQLAYYRQTHAATESDSGFFNLATPDYLAAIACFILTEAEPYRRNCQSLLRYVSGVSFETFIAAARKSPIVGLQVTASMAERADRDTRGNIEYTAKVCLNPWANPEIAAISRVSDWHPSSIRRDNATVYLCVSHERLEDSPGLIRLILGQHLIEFMRHSVGNDTPWVQLFVDEAPQLHSMNVLKRAIEIGRNQRVRLWMAMQWPAQLADAYGKDAAAGMIGACGLQAYMNPALGDDAEAVSKKIGTRRNPLAQREDPVETPQALAGVDFANDVIVFHEGNYVRLRKAFVSNDRKLKGLLGALS